MTERFHRRIYSRPGQFLTDVRFVMARRRLIRRAMRELISFDFRERLMMVVTEVNGCRYCSYYHSRQSLASGISEPELRELLAGSIPQNAPADELPALLYARHWAQTNAQPDRDAEQRLRDVYGEEKAEAIHIVLRMIRIGNLLGNVTDYLLYRLTFGLVGLRQDEARFLDQTE
ncbi:MAG: carboxymuconolactone decarboxylase family protein [Thermoleophilia bacterium]